MTGYMYRWCQIVKVRKHIEVESQVKLNIWKSKITIDDVR